MRSQHAIGLAALVLFATAATQIKADITYNLVNYSVSQGGDTLSGSITTNGTIGLLAETDILSVNFTIVTPTATYVVPAARPVSLFEAVSATATELFLPYSTTASESISLFGPPSPFLGGNMSVSYVYNPGSNDQYDASGDPSPGLIWFVDFPGPNPAAVAGVPGSVIGNDPMLIAEVASESPASVPEPATICSLGFALLLFGGYSALRRRQAA